MFLLSILAVGVSMFLGYFYYQQRYIDIGICTDGDVFPRTELMQQHFLPNFSCAGECYFSDGYESATKLFERSASFASARITSMDVTAELSTKVAILDGKPDTFLIHISGTHGAEAYVGSAVQSAALQYIGLNNVYREDTRAELPTLIFVHANNPYGFKTGRRVNEDNVDLNRNFLNDEEFARVRGRDPNYASYVDLNDILNPTAKPSRYLWVNELYSVYTMIAAVAQHGITSLKRAMVSGNYHKQDGYGFGGFQRTRSTDNLIHLLVEELQLPEKAKHLVLIDVHTGLGPSGVDTLLDLALASKDTAARPVDFSTIFPQEVDPDTGRVVGGLQGDKPKTANRKQSTSSEAAGAAVASGYELTVGTVAGGLCSKMVAPHLSGTDRLCVTQEFGTVNMLQVGKYGIDENYAFFHGSQEEKDYYLSRFKDCFYVQTRQWKRRVVRRGLKLLFEGLAHLGAKI